MTTYPCGDLCLKFPDEATAAQALKGYPGAVDVIGTICKPTGSVTQTEYGPVPVLAPIPGWHVNTRGPITPELQVWAVQPANPARVWG